MIHVILLSGGSGTRLWPLSNETRSKQFLKVLRSADGHPQSMVQRSFEQLMNTGLPVDVVIATSQSQVSSIQQQLPDGAYRVVIEPERRDTMPAILLACAEIAEQPDATLADTVIVMPIDTFAEDDYFASIRLLDQAVQRGNKDIVLLGVRPAAPSEKFGYILPGSVSYDQKENNKVYDVTQFIEKPKSKDAQHYIEKGALWNCGVFAFKLEYIRNIAAHMLEDASFERLTLKYAELPKISFDYGVVERADSVGVLPYEGIWEDLGTWNTLSAHMEQQVAGRVMIDEASCPRTCVINETGLPLVVAGFSDGVVIATHDGILVSSLERSATIRGMVELAKESRPMYEQRHWGEYRVLDFGTYEDGRRSLTKELIIKSGCQISYQKHFQRTEVWTVVSGRGQVVLDGVSREIAPGSVINVQPGQMHGVCAVTQLRIIEVQLGDLLEEEDIQRFGFFWSEDALCDETDANDKNSDAYASCFTSSGETK